MANIAAARDMMTLAEGVETSEQRRSLRALGWQGFLPVPAPEILRLLQSRPDQAVA